MELSSRELNVIVFFCQKKAIKKTCTHQMIVNTFGEEKIGPRRVQQIARDVKNGIKVDFERVEGSGRLRSQKRDDIVERIEKNLVENEDICLKLFA